MATKGIKLTFTKDKETKTTHRYREDGDPDKHIVKSVYLKKTAVEKLGTPDKITVSISASDE